MPPRERNPFESDLSPISEAAFAARVVARSWPLIAAELSSHPDLNTFRGFVEALIRFPFLKLQESLARSGKPRDRDPESSWNHALAAEVQRATTTLESFLTQLPNRLGLFVNAIRVGNSSAMFNGSMEFTEGSLRSLGLIERSQSLLRSDFKQLSGPRPTVVKVWKVMGTPLWGEVNAEVDSQLFPLIIQWKELLANLDLEALAGNYDTYIRRGFEQHDLERLTDILLGSEPMTRDEAIARDYYLMAMGDPALLPLVGGTDDGRQLSVLARRAEEMRLYRGAPEFISGAENITLDPVWMAWFIEIQYPRILGWTNSPHPNS